MVWASSSSFVEDLGYRVSDCNNNRENTCKQWHVQLISDKTDTLRCLRWLFNTLGQNSSCSQKGEENAVCISAREQLATFFGLAELRRSALSQFKPKP